MIRRVFSLMAMVAIAPALYSASFVIPSGTIETTNQVLTDTGDRGIVEEGAAIISAGNGVTISGNEQLLINRGIIDGQSTAVQSFLGVSNSKIFNAGTITSNNLFGAVAIDNSTGFILDNRGSIIGQGATSAVRVNGGTDFELLNSGLLSNDGNNTIVLDVSNNNNFSLNNSGIINATGDNSFAFLLNFGSNASIENTGIIRSEGAGSTAIFVGNSPNTVLTNAGTIRAPQGNAITFSAGATNPTLILKRGSIIEGVVTSLADTLNVTVSKGLNAALTLDDAGMGFGNLNIDNPFAVSGNTLAVYDRTTLIMQPDILADLSDVVLGSVYQHRFSFATCCTQNYCQNNMWIQGVGSYRRRHQENYSESYNNRQAGFLAGINTPMEMGYVGLFGGIVRSKAQEIHHAARANVDSYLAGLTFERGDCDDFYGLAMALGYLDWHNERKVAYNLAESGIENARFSQDGFMVSPELTWSHNIASIAFRPNFTATLRYAGLFLGDCKEHGSVANFKLKDRSIHLLNPRIEFSLPLSCSSGDCCISFEPYIGAFGRFRLGGDTVHGRLLDQSLSFKTHSPDNVGAFLAGIRGSQTIGEVTLYLNVEGSIDSYTSSRAYGELGINYGF